MRCMSCSSRSTFHHELTLLFPCLVLPSTLLFPSPPFPHVLRVAKLSITQLSEDEAMNSIGQFGQPIIDSHAHTRPVVSGKYRPILHAQAPSGSGSRSSSGARVFVRVTLDDTSVTVGTVHGVLICCLFASPSMMFAAFLVLVA